MLPWIAGGWLSGLFVGAQWQSAGGSLFLGLSLVGAMLLALHGQELRARLWAVPLGLLALLAGLGVDRPASPACTEVGTVAGEARVESVRYRAEEALVELALAAGERVAGRTSFEHAPPRGSAVAFEAELRPRTTLHNPSPHPAISPRRGGGCWAKWRGEPPFEIQRASRWRLAVHRARARVRRHLIATLPEDAASVARALVLGDGAALGYERRKTIAAVGLAHLFAVSGLHIALVSGSLVGLLRWLARGLMIGFDPRRLAAALGVPLTLLHAVFAGASPSASRAAITAAFTWSLVAAGRRPSAPAITAAAALALSAPDPSMALRPAFLLSIVATSAILSAARPAGPQGWRWLRAAATISARTLVATAPMVWWWFGGVPLIGWLTNIVVLPFGSWVVIPLAHLVAATAWAPQWVDLPAQLLTLSVRALLAVCEALTPLAVTRRLPPLDPVQGVVVLVACLALLIARRWRTRLCTLGVAALAWWVAEQALVAREQPRDLLRVTFVDVGQGDAALIDLPDGRLALIDTGQGGRHPAGRELRGLLAARRRARIDLLVLTHGHPDHYGGLAELLDEVDIGEVWLNGQLLVEERDGGMERLLNEALGLGAELRFAPELCRTTHDFGGAHVRVLWPCPRYDPSLDLNDNSLTVRLTYGNRSFLMTGDLEAAAERRLAASGAIDPVDVLKVAHHGSRTSSAAAFLRAARPSLAVISSGAGNRYGHPSPTVLRRLHDAGVRVLRTDRGGGVIVTTDGDALEVRR